MSICIQRLGSAVQKRRQPQPYRQIGPMRIFVVDKVYLPRAVPILQLFLALYCRGHIAKQFKMNKAIDAVFGGKTIGMITAMLNDAPYQIRSHSDVKRAVMFARQYINAGLLFISHRMSVAARWMLKQVQHDGIFHKQRHFQNQRHPELVSGSIARFTQLVRNKQISQHTFVEAAKQRSDALDHVLLFFSHRLSLAARWTLERQSPKVKQVQGDGILQNLRCRLKLRHPELVSGSIARFTQLVRNKQISQHTFLWSRAIIND